MVQLKCLKENKIKRNKSSETIKTKKQLKRWQEMFNNARWGLVLCTGKTGKLKNINPAFAQMHGFVPDELKDRSMLSLFINQERDKAQLYLNESIKQGHYSFDSFHEHKDGHSFPVHIDISSVQSSSGKFLYCIVNVQDISERVKIESKLKKAKQDAEAANLEKSEFLATMSHEIRTPMNGVLSLIDLLQNTPLNSTQKKYINTIARSGQILQRVINDILDFSRIQAGRLVLENISFDLQKMLLELQDLFKQQAKANGLTLKLVMDEHLPEAVVGDPHRLTQVLFNLMGNAIKFTDHGHVICSIIVEKSSTSNYLLRFMVQDTGIGISLEDQNKLFKVFSQADSSTQRKYGGTGLGLIISKRIINMMGGELEFTSQTDKGSSFWFTINLEKPKQQENQDVLHQISLSEHPLSYRFNILVLLVEDNPINQEVAIANLQQLGCQVVLANNGQQAVDLLFSGNQSFDLIFMDCEMPIKDGYQATREIRQWEHDANISPIPIIALTAHALSSAKTKSIAAGMNGYLVKPVYLADFIKTFLNRLPSKCQHNSDYIIENTSYLHVDDDTLTENLEDKHKPNYKENEFTEIDMIKIKQLKTLQQAGKEDIIKKMVHLYCNDMQPLVDTIMQNKDAQRVRKAAHSLKSSSALIGAHHVSKIAQEIEMSDQNAKVVDNSAKRLQLVFNRSKKQLNILVNTL